MPLNRYGVLAGRVLESRSEGGTDSPHFQIRVRGGDTDFRVAVNVLSQQAPSELLYVADEAFEHPLVQTLPDLPDGFTAVPSRPGGIALDYIRANLFDRREMRALPPTAPGPDNDLADKLDHYVSRAVADPAARLYAFGERWGPEVGRPDKIFGFSPGNGVHDIHMNQGNTGRFRRDDGVWQDGGLLLHYPGADQWVAIFLAFQSQAWHTDDQTGHTVPDLPDPGPAPVPGPAEPDHLVRIVAALVNPAGPAPERETVTLLNTGAQALDLGSWALLDRLKQRMPLDPITLPAGETIRIQLRPPKPAGLLAVGVDDRDRVIGAGPVHPGGGGDSGDYGSRRDIGIGDTHCCLLAVGAVGRHPVVPGRGSRSLTDRHSMVHSPVASRRVLGHRTSQNSRWTSRVKQAGRWPKT